MCIFGTYLIFETESHETDMCLEISHSTKQEGLLTLSERVPGVPEMKTSQSLFITFN